MKPILIPILVVLSAAAIVRVLSDLIQIKKYPVEYWLPPVVGLALVTVLRVLYVFCLYVRCRMSDAQAPGCVQEARFRLYYWMATRLQALGEAHECGLAVYRKRVESPVATRKDVESRNAVAMIRQG